MPDNNTLPPTAPLCAVCKKSHAVYTCPNCTVHTCSMVCSANHKTMTGCNGERNKAAYISFGSYGWGEMMNDYSFLEDIGRRVGGWEKDIAKGGYTVHSCSSTKTEIANRSRKSTGPNYKRPFNIKRENLRVQLEARDIHLDLLPTGMERRKINQSYWDHKKKTAFMTIEFMFHPSQDLVLPTSELQESPVVLLSHKNNIETPLLSLIQQVARNALAKQGDSMEWIQHLVVPHSDDPESFRPPYCTMKAEHDLRTAAQLGKEKRYHKFDSSSSLAKLLRHTHFIEFPMIEVWENFPGIEIDETSAVIRHSDLVGALFKHKRRRRATALGRRSMNALLGGYGSDEEPGNLGNEVFSRLSEYADCEDEDM